MHIYLNIYCIYTHIYGEIVYSFILYIYIRQALLGHLWSMPTPPTIPFPSWSSLWFSQLGPSLLLLLPTMNSCLNFCLGILKHSPDDASPRVYYPQCSTWLQTRSTPVKWRYFAQSLHPACACVHSNLHANDEMLWLMAAAWLAVRMRRNYQMLFLARVWLIHDKLQQGRIVSLTLKHANKKSMHPRWKELRLWHESNHLMSLQMLHIMLTSCWGRTTQYDRGNDLIVAHFNTWLFCYQHFATFPCVTSTQGMPSYEFSLHEPRWTFQSAKNFGGKSWQEAFTVCLHVPGFTPKHCLDGPHCSIVDLASWAISGENVVPQWSGGANSPSEIKTAYCAQWDRKCCE